LISLKRPRTLAQGYGVANLERYSAMRASLTIGIFLAVNGIALAYTPAEIAAESKKANHFFEQCWDETLSRHPVDESYYGIKTHYDQLEDLSDEKAAADEKVCERQLADLKKNIKFEALFVQTQLNYKLLEREAAREAEEFEYRFDVYPVSQMRGVHAQMPTFMINIHKIDDVRDAAAYIEPVDCLQDRNAEDSRAARKSDEVVRQ
jgi:uncharacterized protein (DUF885 family)